MTQPEEPSSGTRTQQRRGPAVEPGIRRLLGILVVAVAIGTIMTIVGELILHEPPIKDAGFTLALTAAGFYFFIRFLGRMRARQGRDQATRREELRQDQDGGGA